MTYAHADAASAEVRAPPAALFDHLDDPIRLGSHMERPSVMMMGGRMTYELDEAKGRAVGSVITMGGPLSRDRAVPRRSGDGARSAAAQGVGDARAAAHPDHRLVSNGVRDHAHRGSLQAARVFIEYDRASSAIGRVLGSAIAPIYARWSVKRMADDARSHFQ